MKNFLSKKKVELRGRASLNRMYYDGEGIFRPKNLAFYDIGSPSSPYSNGWVINGNMGGWYIDGGYYELEVPDIQSAYSIQLNKAIDKEVSLGCSISGRFTGWVSRGVKENINNRAVEQGRLGVYTYSFNLGCAVETEQIRITYTYLGTVYTTPNGVLGDANVSSATINYATGEVSVTFSVQIDNKSVVYCSYKEDSYFNITQAAIVGIGSGANLEFYGVLQNLVEPNTIRIFTVCNGEKVVIKDDGNGNFISLNPSVPVTGTINYISGAYSLVFEAVTEPDKNEYLYATYALSGLKSSNINHNTGEITLQFSGAYPSVGSLLQLLYVNKEKVDYKKLPNGVVTCTALLHFTADSVASFRSTYSWGYEGSEDEDDQLFTIRTTPGKWVTVSFFVKTDTSVNVAVGAYVYDGTENRYIIDAGGIEKVVYNGSEVSYGNATVECNGEYKKVLLHVLPNRHCITVRLDTLSYAFITAFHIYDSYKEEPYERNYSYNALLIEPPSKEGMYLLYEDGAPYWGYLNAGISSVLTINGWRDEYHFLVTGQEGIEPNVSSNNATHVYNFPPARVLGVRRGLISKQEYDRYYHQYYQGLINNTVGTSGTVPNWTYNSGTNERQLHIPEASTPGVTRGTISNAWYTKKDTEVSITNHTTSNYASNISFSYSPRTLTFRLPHASNGNGGISNTEYNFMMRDISYNVVYPSSSFSYSYDAYSSTLYIPKADSSTDGMMSWATYSYLYYDTEPNHTYTYYFGYGYNSITATYTPTSTDIKIYLDYASSSKNGLLTGTAYQNFRNRQIEVNNLINTLNSKVTDLNNAVNNVRSVCRIYVTCNSSSYEYRCIVDTCL